MGLTKKIRLLVISCFLVIAVGCTNNLKWKYQLPNDYEVKRIDNKTVIIGKKINNVLETVIDEKQVGIEEYVSKFSYSDNYIKAMCLIPTDDKLILKYYIIDTKNDYRYGPYSDEETLEKVKEKIVDEEFGEWIDTIEKPDNAVLD